MFDKAATMSVVDELNAARAEIENFRSGLPSQCDETKYRRLMIMHDALADALSAKITEAEHELSRVLDIPEHAAERGTLQAAIQVARGARENGFVRPVIRNHGRGR